MKKNILLIVLAILIIFFYVWQQNFQTHLGYRVAELKTECEKWQNENESLRIKINKLISMDKLDAVAKQRKLFNPDEKSVIYLE